MKKIVFMGTPDFASQILNNLTQDIKELSTELNAEIVGVYCQPDKPAGRGNKLKSPPVKLKAEEFGFEVFQPINFKEQKDIDILANLKADILIVAAYGLILPEKVLSIPTLGAYNIHASLLPQWRGAAPVQRGILAGDKKTGVTIMRMEKGLDTGDILLQQAFPIAHNDTSTTLLDAMAEMGSKLMISALKQIFDMRAAFIPQNNELATYANKILKEEYLFDWNISAIEIDGKVRALLTPRTTLNTRKDPNLTVQILEGSVIEYERKDEISGSILLAENDTIIIATNDKNLAYSIKKIKPIGKNAMNIKDFINGYIK